MNRAGLFKGLAGLILAPSATKLIRGGDGAQTIKLSASTQWNHRQFNGVTFEGPAEIHIIGKGSVTNSVLWRKTPRERAHRTIQAHNCDFHECRFNDVTIIALSDPRIAYGGTA